MPTWGAQAGIGPVAAPVAGPALLPALAIDGKAVRGAIGADGQIPYLLAAATHQNTAVVAERLIGPKTNEVPEFAPLLRGLPLGGWVLTMDAAHTVRSHARFIAEELLAHYVMIVKQNTKGLYDRLNSLDWAAVPLSHRSVDTGHGRREVRTIQVTDAPADLGFPHAAQIFLLERYTTRTVRKRHTARSSASRVTVAASVVLSIIRERIVAGLDVARARGRKGGRRPKMTPAKLATARQLYDGREHTVAQIADIIDVSRCTVHWALAEQPTGNDRRCGKLISMRRRAKQLGKGLRRIAGSSPTSTQARLGLAKK